MISDFWIGVAAGTVIGVLVATFAHLLREPRVPQLRIPTPEPFRWIESTIVFYDDAETRTE